MRLFESILGCLQPLVDCVDDDPWNCRNPRVVPTLPQNDPPELRRHRTTELRAMQAKYEYDYSYIPGLAMLKSVPLREYPALDWLLLALGQGVNVAENLIELLASERSYVGGSNSGDDACASPDHRTVIAGRADLKRIRSRHEDLIDQHGHRVDAVKISPDIGGGVAGEREVDSAVFGGDGTHLLWRDTWEMSSACSCGANFQRCFDPCGRVIDIGVDLLAPCAYCSKQLAVLLLDEIERLIRSSVETLLSGAGLFGRAASIGDFDHQFQTIPLPTLGQDKNGVRNFEDDCVFALRQVAGQNPMMLTLVRDAELFKKKMPITDDMFSAAAGSAGTFDDAVSKQRVFCVDYDFSADVLVGSDQPTFAGQKYIGSPIGLFALDDADQLVPVAIQCRQSGPDNPIITPADGNWSVAKTVFDNAAGNNSEFVQHLGYAHLLIEAFAMAAARTLPSNHPLAVLLAPHAEGTLFVNDTAQSGMNEPPELNVVGAEISATIADTLRWTSDAVASVDVSEWSLPKILDRNGTADPEVLPHYPYRDDALLIWRAIHDWIGAYLGLYYRCDDDIIDDDELQRFGQECVAGDGARLHGVGDHGRFSTVDQLIDTIAVVVYQGSAHHAATNFPLQNVELYAPALPLAMYQPPPTRTSGDDMLDYLPPLEISAIQQSLYYVIGTVHYTQLGHYAPTWFADPRVEAPLSRFQRRLGEIEVEIRQANKNRPMPYIYLLPSRIPQSTNI